MCHLDICSRWPLSHHMPLMSCVLLISCHMVPTPDASKDVKFRLFWNLIRGSEISRDNLNGEVRFVIRDLEKFRILIEITVLPVFRKLEFSQVLHSSLAFMV